MKNEARTGYLVPNPKRLIRDRGWELFGYALDISDAAAHHHAGLRGIWMEESMLSANELKPILGECWDTLVGPDKLWLEIQA